MEIDTSQFKDAIDKFRVQVEKDATNNLVNAVSYVLEEAKNKAPIDLGPLKENSGYCVIREDNILKGYIGFMEFYAVYVHQGTGMFALKEDGRQTPWWWQATSPKWIAISKKLKFKNGWIRTRGQKPKQFLYNAVINNLDTIQEKLGG